MFSRQSDLCNGNCLIPGDPRRVEVALPVRLVVDDVPLVLGPGDGLDEELLGHLPGEVVLAGVAVDEGGVELLGGLHLLLERPQVTRHYLLLVGLTCRVNSRFALNIKCTGHDYEHLSTD